MKRKKCGKCGKVRQMALNGKRKDGAQKYRNVCNSCKGKSPNNRRKVERPIKTKIPDEAPTKNPQILKLWQLASTRPQAFEELCDRMDVSPKIMRKLIQEARDGGLSIHVENDHVGARVQSIDDEQNLFHKNDISPVVGKEVVVGVISDTHYGSKYCLRGHIKDAVKKMYEAGARIILHPGDVIDGCYRHGEFELTHYGLEDQVRDLFKNLPKHKGLSYHCITGNHDDTFWDRTGVNVGHYIEGTFRRRGRNDIHFYGQRGAFLNIYGVRVHLWHPRGGGSYARSYALQKKLEGYMPGEKPKIMVAGHWHQYCHIHERGIHAFMCPTFQGGGSAFGRSMRGSPNIGGLLFRWRLAENGTLRQFNSEKFTYYEREVVHEVGESE